MRHQESPRHSLVVLNESLESFPRFVSRRYHSPLRCQSISSTFIVNNSLVFNRAKMNRRNQEQTLPHATTNHRQHRGAPQHPAPSYRTGAAFECQQTNLLPSFSQLMRNIAQSTVLVSPAPESTLLGHMGLSRLQPAHPSEVGMGLPNLYLSCAPVEYHISGEQYPEEVPTAGIPELQTTARGDNNTGIHHAVVDSVHEDQNGVRQGLDLCEHQENMEAGGRSVRS